MHKTPELSRLIHENAWVVFSFAFGQPVIAKVVGEKFQGEWKYLNKTIYELAKLRTDRALLEMAVQLRALDDEEGINEYLKATKSEPLGTVTQDDGSVTDMHFRDLTNKIMHCASYEWCLSKPGEPTVICHSRDPSRWQKAEINLLALMALIGVLGF